MKLLLLLFAIVVEGMLDCPKYIASDKLGTDICTNDRESSPVVRPSLYIRPCKENQYCDPSTGLPFKCKDIDPKPAPNRHHGEICTANGECISEACKDGFCTAKVADGEKCTDTRECAVGSYCKGTPPEQKNCTKLIAVGEDCTGPFQCVQSSVCNKGKCVRKGSLRDGDEANNADACTSKALNASNTGCGRGLKLAYFNGTNGPVACSGEKASYLDSEDKIIEMPCMCGYNPNGVPYSPIYSGDLDVSDV